MNRRRTAQRSLIKFVQPALGIALLLAVLIWNHNGRRVLELIPQIRLTYLALLATLSVVLNLVSAAKWGLILRARGISVSWMRLNVLYLIGKFFNNFMPSMVGGDITRVLLLGRHINSQSKSAASVFVERFTGVMALVGLAFLFALMNPTLLRQPTIAVAMGLILTGCVATAVLLFNPALASFILSPLARISVLSNMLPALETLYAETSFFKTRYWLIVMALGYSVLFYFVASVSIFVACLAVGLSPAFLEVALVTPILFLVTAIPVSPNNIGWWEWSASILLVEVGAEVAQGLSVALILRAVSLIISLIGGALFLFGGAILPAHTSRR